jgi:peptidoglycan/LPS O-acetylase OafA/YrhL
VVLGTHCVLIDPELAEVSRGGAVADEFRWAMTYTPLHLLWAGSEAVLAFFVLSGFVLALPFLDMSSRPSWRGYYLSRALRIYVPAVASLALGLAAYQLVDHTSPPGASWWLRSVDVDPTPGMVAYDATLILGNSLINVVLWSLRIELLFSIVLPLIALLVARLPRCRPLVLLAAVGTTAGVNAGVVVPETIGYCAVFLIGVVAAAERERLAGLLTHARPGIWAALVVGASALWLVQWWPVAGRTTMVALFGQAIVGVATVGFVAAALWCSPVRRFLTGTSMQWVGKRSFSLYLCHSQVVICTALLLPGRGPAVVAAISIPLSLLLTAGFYRLIERPSHLLARRAGKAVAARSRPLTGA